MAKYRQLGHMKKNTATISDSSCPFVISPDDSWVSQLLNNIFHASRHTEKAPQVNIPGALSVWLSSEARGGIWLVQACSSAPWPFLSPPSLPGCCPTSRLAGWLAGWLAGPAVYFRIPGGYFACWKPRYAGHQETKWGCVTAEDRHPSV